MTTRHTAKALGGAAGLLLAGALLSGCAVSSSGPAPAPGADRSTPLIVISGPSTASSVPLLVTSPDDSASLSVSPTAPAASSATSDAAAIDAAALAGVNAIEAADTRRDHSPRDTLLRAGKRLTPSFTDRVRSGPDTSSATWSTWAKHHARISVRTRLAADDHPVDTAAIAYRQVVAVLTATGEHGWKAAPTTAVVFIALRPVDGHWLIDSIQTT